MEGSKFHSWKAPEDGNDRRGGQVKCKSSWVEIVEENSGHTFQVTLTVFTSNYFSQGSLLLVYNILLYSLI